MMIIHLNGWPGVGKLTVARILSQRLQARLIDNHLLHDVAIQCTGPADDQRWPLYETVRAAAYGALAGRPSSESLVMTNALCVGAPREQQAWGHVVDLAIARGGTLVPVVLIADIEENKRRIQSDDRSARKLKAPEMLEIYYQSDDLQRPDVPELLEIDTTHLAAMEAAIAIEGHIRSLTERGLLLPASERHLKMKASGWLPPAAFPIPLKSPS